MTVDPYRTALPCSPPCAERHEAVVDEQFLPARSLGGWIFRDGPERQLNEGAKWKAAYFGQELEDHTHEPYTWVSCPFCGGALPAPPDDEGLGDPDE
jgi:hypothetical protein